MRNKTVTAQSLALKHLVNGGKVLGIGHSENPESTYKNPQLISKDVPMAIPHGLGRAC